MKDITQLPVTELEVDWHCVAGPNLKEITQTLWSELQAFWQPQKTKTTFQEALFHTLDVCIANLSNCKPTQRLAIHNNRAWFANRAGLFESQITYATVSKVTDFLLKSGYANYDAGSWSSRSSYWRSASLWPTELLRVLLQREDDEMPETIRLPGPLIRLRDTKDRNKKFLPFEDTSTTLAQASNLEKLNRLIGETDVTLGLTSRQWDEMLLRVVEKARLEDRVPVHIPAKLGSPYYRVFNDGDWNKGGRIYCRYHQSIPSRYRPYVQINGEAAVEVDYAAMHPTMLYAKLGLQLERDPYPTHLGDRRLVKKTFNALLNAKRRNIRPLKEFDEAAVGMPWREFVSEVISGMGPLKEFLLKGKGLELQRLDSDIAEAVVMEFVERGIPILPIHDSFQVAAKYEGFLRRVMQEKFDEKTGFKCRTETTWPMVNFLPHPPQRRLVGSVGEHPTLSVRSGGDCRAWRYSSVVDMKVLQLTTAKYMD